MTRLLLIVGLKIGMMLPVYFVAMSCHCHKKAIEMVVTLPVTTKHVGELLSSTLAEDWKKNCLMLLHILGVRFLGRQGLALRGSALFSEVDGNFSQLLHLFSEYDEQLACFVGLREKTTSILLLICKMKCLK